MPSLSNTLLALAASAPAVLGHGHVRRVIVDDVTYPGFERWSNEDQSQAVTWHFTTEDEGPVPVSSLNTPDIICHLGATNAQASIPVAAGSQLQVVRFNTIGGFEHPGPEMHYLAPCGDAGCANVDKNDLRFFKFYESGLVQPEGFVDTFTVTIPQNIRPGSYVLRHEILGLHKAHEGEAEFYPQCINLEISGSGDQLPEGVPATEMYHSSDPGVALDIWVDLQSYQIPGPAVTNLSFKRDTTARAAKRHPRDLKH
ncbi:glycoside hydrolase family 61 protein [Daldinia eschscholtzii]|nr:glycoside hydrolase family 61 protein [Daldinia eschscholtzii]